MPQGYRGRDDGRGRPRARSSPTLPPVARKAGPLLLLAFLVAVMAGGSGGVTAPWVPGSPGSPPEPVTLAEARLAMGGGAWRLHRME
jgi:hypothetical protein